MQETNKKSMPSTSIEGRLTETQERFKSTADPMLVVGEPGFTTTTTSLEANEYSDSAGVSVAVDVANATQKTSEERLRSDFGFDETLGQEQILLPESVLRKEDLVTHLRLISVTDQDLTDDQKVNLQNIINYKNELISDYYKDPIAYMARERAEQQKHEEEVQRAVNEVAQLVAEAEVVLNTMTTENSDTAKVKIAELESKIAIIAAKVHMSVPDLKSRIAKRTI